MTAPDEAARARAGMLAAVECCRIQHTGMAQAADPVATDRERLAAQVTAAAALEGARRDAEAADLDLDGALISITLRAASLASSVIDGMTVPRFLDLLEAEIQGWRPDEVV